MDMVYRPKKNGGLGVLNLKVQNDAMLLKLLHKFYNKFDTPRVHLIWGSYCTTTVPHAASPCGSFWWRELIKLMPACRGVSKVKIGSGATTLFWKDNWSNCIIADNYPRVFSYTTLEDASVNQLLTITSIDQGFHLPLSVQAHEELRTLQQNVRSLEITDANDTWTCTWGASESKTTAYYTVFFREMIVHDAYKWLWNAKSIPKLKVFGSFLLSDRLNARNMLKRSHYNIVNNFDCLLCGQHIEETVEHLFSNVHSVQHAGTS